MNPMQFMDTLKKHQSIMMIYKDNAYSYAWLVKRIAHFSKCFDTLFQAGDVIQLMGDYSPEWLAIGLALALKKTIVMPLPQDLPIHKVNEYAQLTGAKGRIGIDQHQMVLIEAFQAQPND